MAASDVLLSLYQTGVGDPAVSGYTPFSVDLSALLAANLGQTLRLRFAETDNVGPLQLGVDNVSFDSANPVPEPATLVLLGTGLESSTGADSGVALEVPLMGNRVDRFVWDGNTLTRRQALPLHG